MSYSNSRSTSSSVPQNMYSAETSAALQIAKAAAALGEQTYNWAVQSYNTTTAMTDQAVQQYLQMSQYGLGLSKEQLQDYNNIYRPEDQQLAQLASTYSSTARQAVNMGAAESASEQGSAAGINNARANLQSYGIDPSSGMYGELEEAQNASAGAAAAGAGQQAELATQATGRQLLGESIQVGEQLPGDIVNDLTSAYQGVAGAENSVLSNAQTGANAFDAANPFLSTAMNLKYPPIGNTQGSSSLSTSTPRQTSSGTSGGGGGSSGRPGGTYRTPQQGGGGGNSGGGATRALPNGGNGANGLGALRNVPGGGYGNYAADVGQAGNYSDSTIQPFDSNFNQPGTQNTSFFDPYSATASNTALPVDNSSNAMQGGVNDQTLTNPFSAGPTAGVNAFGGDTGFGANTGFGGGDSGIPSVPYMPDTGSDTTFSNPGQSTGFGGGYQPPAPPTPDTSGNDVTDSINQGNYQQQQQQQQGNYQQQQQQGNYQPQGGYGGYARGGAIPAPQRMRMRMPMTTGGRVPLQASPSMGQQTDDVPARLNAGEFVVPKDVAAWKGQEFFQKLIEQSRKSRMGAPAKPSAKQPLPAQHKPTFVSQRMGIGR